MMTVDAARAIASIDDIIVPEFVQFAGKQLMYMYRMDSFVRVWQKSRKYSD